MRPVAGEAWILLDRDGTLNIDTDFVFDAETVRLVQGAGLAVAEFRRLGLYPVVVSNQSGIAREKGTLEQMRAVNARLQELLKEEDSLAQIDHWLFCPHLKSDDCLCRKPRIGMLRGLFDAGLRFDPQQSWMAGDRISDIELGINLGIPADQCLYLETPHERPVKYEDPAEILALQEQTEQRLSELKIPRFPNLPEALPYIRKMIAASKLKDPLS